jgi:catechol 2,3-dioxygenase-like lactoylglutathione lyase family enzyme
MMRLRQVALAARDLDRTTADLCAVFGIEVAFRDPGVATFGLRNAVMPVGETFLEVVSPAEAQTAAGRFLDRRGGDGGYMVIFQCDDLERERQRLTQLGVRVVWNADLPDARTIHLHPRDVGGAIVSFDTMTPPDSWRWAGPRWRECVRTEVTLAITGVELQADDPTALAHRWSAVLDRPLAARADGGWAIVVDNGELCFTQATDGRSDGVGGITVAVADRERVLQAARRRGVPIVDDQLILCGTRIRLA